MLAQILRTNTSYDKLTEVSFLSFQRVIKLFSLSICCTWSSLTCWKKLQKNKHQPQKTVPITHKTSVRQTSNRMRNVELGYHIFYT